jgi:hypothetical protein
MVAYHRWVYDTEDQLIFAIAIQDTLTSVVVQIKLSNLELIIFDVSATSNAVVLWSHWLEIEEIQGQCCPRMIQSWIELPHSVHPETLWVEDRNEISLLIRLSKRFNLEKSQPTHYSEPQSTLIYS